MPGAAPHAARLVGAGALGAAAVVLAVPGLAVDAGPWSLTPLTARVIACFTAQVGIGALLLSRDERWDAWRVLLQTVLVASALLAAGVARAWEDLLLDRPAAWLFLAGLAALATAVAGLYTAMARTERPRPGPGAPEAGPGRLPASRPP